jgi:hypothetical protein
VIGRGGSPAEAGLGGAGAKNGSSRPLLVLTRAADQTKRKDSVSSPAKGVHALIYLYLPVHAVAFYHSKLLRLLDVH